MSGIDPSPKLSNMEAWIWGDWRTDFRLNRVFKRMLSALE